MNYIISIAALVLLTPSMSMAEQHQHTMPIVPQKSEPVVVMSAPENTKKVVLAPSSTEVQMEVLKTMQAMVQKMDTLADKLSKLEGHDSTISVVSSVMPDKPVTPMRGKEHEMRLLLQQIEKTQDINERKRLMQAHLKSMQEMMSLMHKPSEMADSSTEHDMSKMEESDDMMSKMMAKMEKMQKMKKSMTKLEPQAMEQRINELQLILEQLLQHQVLQEVQ